MVDLKHLNWTPLTLKLDVLDFKLNTPYPKIGMANLKSHKLYTLDFEIGHEKSETFKLDNPNLEIGHYKHMILQI
jgi:hypothetical protein